MKYIIVGLLSAALILAAQQVTPDTINNSTVRAEAQPVQDQLTSKHDEAIPQPTPTVEPEKPLTGKYALMHAAGIPERDWPYVDYVITHESTWRHHVWNTSGSGAYGLCQSLPATKMASAGEDYMTNPVTQLKWCHAYAQSRYGSWQNAQAFWRTNQWW